MTLRNDGVLDLAFVDPAFTGRGIGGLLLRKIIETAKVRGLERLHTDASLVAYPLFRRHGWTVVRRRTVRRRGVNLINLRMELTL